MNSRGRVVRGLLLLGFLASLVPAACSDDNNTRAVPVAVICSSDMECGSGFCVSAEGANGNASTFCSVECDDDSDCLFYGEFVCGVGPNGLGICMNDSCWKNGFACLDSGPVACAVAPESECDSCGCPSGLHCEFQVGCKERVEVGEPCEADDACKTGNCSTFAGVCRVPLGQACDGTNCDHCYSSGSFSFCSRACESEEECGDIGATCAGYDGYFYCKPLCNGVSDPSCPDDVCDAYFDEDARENVWYCSCDSCDVAAPERAAGDDCTESYQCASGECPFFGTCDEFGCTGSAWCTQSCATNADCPAAMICADIPCGAGVTTFCGPKCLHPCSSGRCNESYCVTLSGADGTDVDVCDPHLEEGASCSSDIACRSELCSAGQCAPSGGAPNGDGCVTGSDCRSQNCVGGTCRGTALLSDPCANSLDCSVGVCCSGVCESSC